MSYVRVQNRPSVHIIYWLTKSGMLTMLTLKALYEGDSLSENKLELPILCTDPSSDTG